MIKRERERGTCSLMDRGQGGLKTGREEERARMRSVGVREGRKERKFGRESRSD